MQLLAWTAHDYASADQWLAKIVGSTSEWLLKDEDGGDYDEEEEEDDDVEKYDDDHTDVRD